MQPVKRKDLEWLYPWSLFIVFLHLKLSGSIDWSWWWVLSPLLIAIFLTVVGTEKDEEDDE